jgi:hypothetical protein
MKTSNRGSVAASVTKQGAEASENAPYPWNPLLRRPKLMA